MALNDSKEIKLNFKSGNFSATNERARFVSKEHITSIPTKEITSVGVKYSEQPIYLILAFIVFAGFSFWSGQESNSVIFFIGVVLAIFVGAFYWLSRTRNLKISSPSGSITMGISNYSHQESVELVDEIEKRITD